MKGLGGLVKSLKKKVTLKGVVRGVAGVAGAIPVIGGAISTAANLFSAAKGKATQAAAAAQDTAVQQLQQSSGTYQTSPTGPQPDGGLLQNPLLWVGVGLAALFLLRRH